MTNKDLNANKFNPFRPTYRRAFSCRLRRLALGRFFIVLE